MRHRHHHLLPKAAQAGAKGRSFQEKQQALKDRTAGADKEKGFDTALKLHERATGLDSTNMIYVTNQAATFFARVTTVNAGGFVRRQLKWARRTINRWPQGLCSNWQLLFQRKATRTPSIFTSLQQALHPRCAPNMPTEPRTELPLLSSSFH